MIDLHPDINQRYADAPFGILLLHGVHTDAQSQAAFAALLQQEIKSLRESCAGYERKAFCQTDTAMSAYIRYYKRYKKTYHVLPQLESILNGKPFPDTLPLIQALFMAELKTSLLIAGHDLRKCRPPLTILPAAGGETYEGSGGRAVAVKPADICLRDQNGFILSILYGQDEQTRITDATEDVLYLIDGVPGLTTAQVENGLDTLLGYVRTFAPEVTVTSRIVLRYQDGGVSL